MQVNKKKIFASFKAQCLVAVMTYKMFFNITHFYAMYVKNLTEYRKFTVFISLIISSLMAASLLWVIPNHFNKSLQVTLSELDETWYVVLVVL